MSNLLPFDLGQEVDVIFRGALVNDIGGNFIDVELGDGEEMTVLPGADGVEVTPAGSTQAADRVLAALAAALTSLPDVQHGTVIMAAAVLAHQQPQLTAQQAAEMAANDCWGEATGAAWREAKRLLGDALAAVDRG